MRIAIAGDGQLGLSLMEPLLASKHEVIALVQDGRETKGFARRALSRAVGSFFGPITGGMGVAIQNGASVCWIDRMTEDELAPLRALEPDVLLVGGFGVILKKSIIELPKIGCVNMHSSLLPKHRGPNPFSAVVLAGENESGVTFHQVDEGIDTGPILDQYCFPVHPEDTAADVYRRACVCSALHVVEVMDKIEQEGMYGRDQDDGGTYDRRLNKADSVIDWSKSAIEIDRKVRGMQPFHLARFHWKEREITVTRTRCEKMKTNARPGEIIGRDPFVRVATGDGVLSILAAYALAPIPWIWPALWNNVKVGDILS
jgi:methionyl-tRNA formyltransferase